MELFILMISLYFILFLISIKIKDNSIVDVFWWTWFIVISLFLFFTNSSLELEKVLILLLIIIWWTRLSYYILKRKLKNNTEDPRYAVWRKTWKYFYTRSFFQVFILQMILMLIISAPLYYIFSLENINLAVFILGFIISIIWLTIEIIADSQVKDFITQNWKTNKVFTLWLYKYSRNPNYFWESAFWLWLSIVWASINLLSFVWFLVITFLLLFVSWVPMKEKRQEKKDNWLEYKQKTNKFIPWVTKK